MIFFVWFHHCDFVCAFDSSHFSSLWVGERSPKQKKFSWSSNPRDKTFSAGAKPVGPRTLHPNGELFNNKY